MILKWLGRDLVINELRTKGIDMISFISEDQERLETIYRVMNSETFGLRTSERIVGGKSRLIKLIEDGKIRAEKPNGTAQNGKWQCNAGDVLRYARIKHL